MYAQNRTFEDLKCWQKARELVKKVYEITKAGPLSKDFKLRDQLRIAAVSSMSNIAEGFESQNDKTFIRFLFISKARCSEVRSQGYVAFDQGYINNEEFDQLNQMTVETSKLLRGFITYLSQ